MASGGNASHALPTTAAAIRAAVEERFAQVARSPGQEQKFPVGPVSARRLGYDPKAAPKFAWRPEDTGKRDDPPK